MQCHQLDQDAAGHCICIKVTLAAMSTPHCQHGFGASYNLAFSMLQRHDRHQILHDRRHWQQNPVHMKASQAVLHWLEICNVGCNVEGSSGLHTERQSFSILCKSSRPSNNAIIIGTLEATHIIMIPPVNLRSRKGMPALSMARAGRGRTLLDMKEAYKSSTCCCITLI